MNAILVEFEKRNGIGPTYAARLLGIAYPTYAAYRSDSRVLPRYHFCQIRAISFMGDADRAQYIKENAYGTR